MTLADPSTAARRSSGLTAIEGAPYPRVRVDRSKIVNAVARIEVVIRVGQAPMAATDDPVFLGVRGSGGREFRLQHAGGASFRRDAEDHYVLAGAREAATNIEHPEMNDPTLPPLDAAAITSLYVRKGAEPIPNVRGIGELDDRLEIVRVEITIHADGIAAPLRFAREGPIWLGLACGETFEVPRDNAEADPLA